MSIDSWLKDCNQLSLDINHQYMMMHQQGFVPIVDRSNRSVLSLLNEIDEIVDSTIGKPSEESLLVIAETVSLIRMKLGFPATCFYHNKHR